MNLLLDLEILDMKSVLNVWWTLVMFILFQGKKATHECMIKFEKVNIIKYMRRCSVETASTLI